MKEKDKEKEEGEGEGNAQIESERAFDSMSACIFTSVAIYLSLVMAMAGLY